MYGTMPVRLSTTLPRCQGEPSCLTSHGYSTTFQRSVVIKSTVMRLAYLFQFIPMDVPTELSCVVLSVN